MSAAWRAGEDRRRSPRRPLQPWPGRSTAMTRKPRAASRRAERRHHVGMIARGAVHEKHDPALGPDRRALDHVDAAAAGGVDPLSDRRKARLDPARPP